MSPYFFSLPTILLLSVLGFSAHAMKPAKCDLGSLVAQVSGYDDESFSAAYAFWEVTNSRVPNPRAIADARKRLWSVAQKILRKIEYLSTNPPFDQDLRLTIARHLDLVKKTGAKATPGLTELAKLSDEQLTFLRQAAVLAHRDLSEKIKASQVSHTTEENIDLDRLFQLGVHLVALMPDNFFPNSVVKTNQALPYHGLSQLSLSRIEQGLKMDLQFVARDILQGVELPYLHLIREKGKHLRAPVFRNFTLPEANRFWGGPVKPHIIAEESEVLDGSLYSPIFQTVHDDQHFDLELKPFHQRTMWRKSRSSAAVKTKLALQHWNDAWNRVISGLSADQVDIAEGLFFLWDHENSGVHSFAVYLSSLVHQGIEDLDLHRFRSRAELGVLAEETALAEVRSLMTQVSRLLLKTMKRDRVDFRLD